MNIPKRQYFYQKKVSKRTKYLHNLLESYWNQRTKEYLNEWRKHHTTGNVNSIIKLGDTVLFTIIMPKGMYGN